MRWAPMLAPFKFPNNLWGRDPIFELTKTAAVHNHVAIAQMAELVDAPASGAGVCMDVEVRVLFWAPLIFKKAF